MNYRRASLPLSRGAAGPGETGGTGRGEPGSGAGREENLARNCHCDLEALWRFGRSLSIARWSCGMPLWFRCAEPWLRSDGEGGHTRASAGAGWIESAL